MLGNLTSWFLDVVPRHVPKGRQYAVRRTKRFLFPKTSYYEQLVQYETLRAFPILILYEPRLSRRFSDEKK